MTSAVATPSRNRLDSIDLLRGIVMVLMLLDHTRDFLHITRNVDPAQLATTTVPLFLTRFVTHFCAPIFVLLAGVGVRLQRERGKPVGELSKFLVTRGLWLIVLEFTVIRYGFTFSFDYTKFGALIQIIWAIGMGMIVLAALIHLPNRITTAIGVIIIFGSNLLDGLVIPAQPAQSAGDILFMMIHAPGMMQPFGPNGPPFLLIYPLLPWIGVLFLGYGLGGLYSANIAATQRKKALIWMAIAGLAMFVVLRVTGVYGDPSPWITQPRGTIYTILSFFNVSKYPASLQYLLLLLSPALLFLAATDGLKVTTSTPTSNPSLTQRATRALVIFGRVPLFFYLLQWFVAHGAGVLLMRVTGHPDGLGLGAVYLTWIAGTILLYFPCRWFAGIKARRRDWWLSYL